MDRKPGHLPRDVRAVASSLIWIKVVGIGNVGVGKTSLIKHFCESKFSTGYQPTVGVDYGFKVEAVQGIDLRVHLWDLSGSCEYEDVRNELYSDTDVVFIVYDVTNQSSFEGVELWLREFATYGNNTALMCLVGNKTDLREDHGVSPLDAKRWAAQRGMSYFETSCASGEGVQTMFSEMLLATTRKKQLAADVSQHPAVTQHAS
ncbi:hypothetical protein NP493_559g01048 [Ridgeia piscesae]|uniref:Uncharacterized protein n=1 Tax=Ridgeia piscesae TaxID=27915 RepID=A0AAD9NSV1_RIDPI|nr:hypothetical protein NP493_559g01048 [Ridgeia piscesae]